MSQIQKMLYKEFMDNLAETTLNTWATTNPIKAFSVCCKVNVIKIILICMHTANRPVPSAGIILKFNLTTGTKKICDDQFLFLKGFLTTNILYTNYCYDTSCLFS